MSSNLIASAKTKKIPSVVTTFGIFLHFLRSKQPPRVKLTPEKSDYCDVEELVERPLDED